MASYYRWQSLKPGKVTVWLEEVCLDYDSHNLDKEFPPKGCYLIDEKLNVTFLKEETEAAQKKFKEKTDKWQNTQEVKSRFRET